MSIIPQNPVLFRASLRNELDDAVKTGVVWLHWIALSAPNSGPISQQVSMAYEALELLALLTCVDVAAFRLALVAIWPRAATRWCNMFGQNVFFLGVRVFVSKRGELTKWAERAWLPDPALEDLHTDYPVVRENLEAALRGRADCQARLPVIKVRVELHDDLQDGDLSSVLFETAQLARTQAGRRAVDAYKPRWMPLFRLHEVNGLAFTDGMAKKDICFVEEIASCGVRLPFFCSNAIEFTDGPDALYSITRLQRLMGTSPKPGYCPVEGVSILFQDSQRTLDSIFSSVFYSTTVREIFVDGAIDGEDHPSGQARLMQWLALCGFGRVGCPSLEKITLDTTNLQMVDVHTLERTLRDDNAFAQLFPEASGSLRTHRTVATASKFMITQPLDLDTAERSAIHLVAPLANLRIIAVDALWVSVLLPGWGQAWVWHSNVSIEHLQTESMAPPTRARRIRRFDFEWVPQSRLPVLFEFLRVVGVGTKSIKIDWSLEERVPIDSDWIRAVCRACPDLEIAYFQVDFESLPKVAQCYEDGICRAWRLVVDAVDAQPDSMADSAFLGHISDEKHPIYHHLRDLVFTVHRTQLLYRPVALLLSKGLNLLPRNRFLWNLEMDIKSSENRGTVSSQHPDEWVSQYERFDGQDVAIRHGPLAMEKKLAFLQVLQGRQQLSRSAARDLDATIVGLIFEFAAVCKCQRVHVSLT